MTQGKLCEDIKTAIENAEWNPEDWTLTYRISEVLDDTKKEFIKNLEKYDGDPYKGSIDLYSDDAIAFAFKQWFPKWFGGNP